jgi:aspartate aminotransferase
MATSFLSSRAKVALETIGPLMQLLTDSAWARRGDEPGACDFMVGNPQEMPLPAFVDSLRRWSEPRDSHWFAYKMDEPSPRAAVAEALRKWRGVPFEPEDIFLTNGAMGGLSVIFGACIEPEDEVIFTSPPWFQYEGMILMAGGKPVRVRVDYDSFDLDLRALEGAITARTRAVIVNSPHNPTGKIYGPETLRALAKILTDASARHGHTIYLVSDEAYSRIVFDGRPYHSPTAFYPHSFLIYTYSKSLLAPGERVGYVALPPEMPDRESVRAALFGVQMLSGWVFPSALLQYTIAEAEGMCIDVPHLQRRRDRLVGALRGMGYTATRPEGTFYVLVRCPIPDAAFADLLAERDVFCIPGSIMDFPGYVRLSITASDEMVERSLPRFAAALEEAKRGKR